MVSLVRWERNLQVHKYVQQTLLLTSISFCVFISSLWLLMNRICGRMRRRRETRISRRIACMWNAHVREGKPNWIFNRENILFGNVKSNKKKKRKRNQSNVADQIDVVFSPPKPFWFDRRCSVIAAAYVWLISLASIESSAYFNRIDSKSKYVDLSLDFSIYFFFIIFFLF